MTLPPGNGEGTAPDGVSNPPENAAQPEPMDHRLHKPGVAGSSPAAATSGTSGTALLRFDEPIGDYHSDKLWWSKSQIWDLHDSGPAYFKARHLDRSIKGFSSDSLVKGTLVHQWFDEGAEAWWDKVREVPAEFIGLNGQTLKKGEEWLASQPDGSIILKPSEVAAYRGQFNAIMENKVFWTLSEATEHREFSIRWTCPNTGLNLRCRPDAATEFCIWDIKTTKEQCPLKTFWKSVIDYGYAFQASLYLAGARAAGFKPRQFVFLVTSTVAPYECHAVVLPPALLAAADRQVRSACADLRDRLAMDYWHTPEANQVTELWFPARYMEETSRGSFPRTRWSE